MNLLNLIPAPYRLAARVATLVAIAGALMVGYLRLINFHEEIGYQQANAVCMADKLIAEQAANEGASYVAFGRFFNSSTKPGAPAATVEMLAQARARLQVPICVIGGITLENAAPLVAHGADLLAVVHGLFGADSTQEVTRRARAFNALLKI